MEGTFADTDELFRYLSLARHHPYQIGDWRRYLLCNRMDLGDFAGV